MIAALMDQVDGDLFGRLPVFAETGNTHVLKRLTVLIGRMDDLVDVQVTGEGGIQFAAEAV